MNWYQYTKQQLAQEFKTDLEKGLTPQEVVARLKQYGANVLPEKPPESWLVIFLQRHFAFRHQQSLANFSHLRVNPGPHYNCQTVAAQNSRAFKHHIMLGRNRQIVFH